MSGKSTMSDPLVRGRRRCAHQACPGLLGRLLPGDTRLLGATGTLPTPWDTGASLSSGAYFSTFQISGSISPSMGKSATPRTFRAFARVTLARTAPASLQVT